MPPSESLYHCISELVCYSHNPKTDLVVRRVAKVPVEEPNPFLDSVIEVEVMWRAIFQILRLALSCKMSL